MAKLEIPMDGSDPNNPNQNNENMEQMPVEGAARKSAGQIAEETAKSGLKNTTKALEDNKGNIGKAAGQAIGNTAADAVKNVGSEIDPETAEKISETIEKSGKVAGTIASTKALLASGVQAASAAVAILIDPITWIVIAVAAVIVMLVIGVVAGVQVVGKTDNADGCYGIGINQTSSGGVSVSAQASEDSMTNAATIADWAMTTQFSAFGNKPMTREQAAGLIGNAWQESKVNPAASQSKSINASSSNADVMSLGKGNGGRAIGLIQWDSERRYYLAQYAESQGKHWSDLGVQLEFLHQEIDGTVNYPGATYNRDLLLQKGFAIAGKDIAHYTEAWEKGFTRAGKPMLQQRIEYANTFNSSYSPGSGTAFSSASSGGSCLSSNLSDSPVASETIALATQIAYPTIPESRTGGEQLGKSKAKPEYIKAKEQAEQIGSKDWYEGLYASCDRAVATVVINTMDKDFPWGNIVEQRKYMDNSSKWTKYTSVSEAKGGDVWVTQPKHDGGGHIVMYLGNVNGKDMIMHASYSSRGNSRVAGLQERKTYISDAMTDKSGRSYYGYRFNG